MTCLMFILLWRRVPEVFCVCLVAPSFCKEIRCQFLPSLYEKSPKLLNLWLLFANKIASGFLTWFTFSAQILSFIFHIWSILVSHFSQSRANLSANQVQIRNLIVFNINCNLLLYTSQPLRLWESIFKLIYLMWPCCSYQKENNCRHDMIIAELSWFFSYVDDVLRSLGFIW